MSYEPEKELNVWKIEKKNLEYNFRIFPQKTPLKTILSIYSGIFTK